MITKEELAKKLNGRQYGKEITRDEENEAKESGLVVVFGQSDDLIELRGAIYDELDMYEGGDIVFDKNGLLVNESDNEECPYFLEKIKNAKKIRALWSDKCWDAAWSFESLDIKDMAKFNIYEGDELYCEGLIFSIEELK